MISGILWGLGLLSVGALVTWMLATDDTPPERVPPVWFDDLN